MRRQRRTTGVRDRIERIRRRAGGQPVAPARKRRVSRREREARRQRQLYWGMGIAAAIVVVILAVGLVNEYVIKPRTVLATVDGTEIRRREYWKVRSVELIEQANQYRQIATSGFVPADQQQQYLQFASQALQELDGVWGSTDTDPTTLDRMIDDQIYLKNLDELGLEVTDEDVNNYLAQRFEPSNAPIFTPTASPTLIPARAEWLTQTAVAEETATASATAAARANAPAPTSSGLPPAPGVSPTPPAATPAAGAQASPGASPGASHAPGTPSPSPTTAATPNAEQAQATAAAGYEEFGDAVFDEAHMSQSEYEALIVRPLVARDKVKAVLEAEVGQSAEQVHAAHILVETKDLATSIYEQLQQEGSDFAQIARDQSTDTASAGNGGDLGWFTRAEMVDPFAEVAFALSPGEISEPFQTEFGWHIVHVFEHEQDRPLTDEQITRLKEERVEDWLAMQKAESSINSKLDPTPTPLPPPFEPPAGAPPVPTATAIPASPEASPAATPTGNLEATSAGSPSAMLPGADAGLPRS